MAEENEILKASNEAAKKLEKAAIAATVAAAMTEAAEEKIAEIKRKKEEALQKAAAVKEKIEQFKLKKQRTQKRLENLQMPKGFGLIILRYLFQTLKSSFRAEQAINLIKKQLEDKCPLPEKLMEIIEKKNRIENSVTTIRQIITTLQTGAVSLQMLVGALDTIIKISSAFILAAGFLPAPPGPTVLTQEGKDIAKKKNVELDVIISQGVIGLTIISTSLNSLILLLQQLEAMISLCLIDLLDNGDINEDQFNEILININTTSTDSSNKETNKIIGEDILNQEYKGFKFEIQNNPNNPLETVPQRRAIGIQIETDILAVATEYSFASSTEVLINEAKFLVDQWLFNTTNFESNIQIPEVIEPEEEILPPPGFYWKYSDTPSIYYEFEGNIEVFNTLEEYYLHREKYNLPKDLSKVQFRGPDPNLAIENEQISSSESEEAAKQIEKNILQGEIGGWQFTITQIRDTLTNSINKVNFNKTNKAIWESRVGSWKPEEWLGKKATNAYSRIENKFGMQGSLGGDLNGALENWFELNNKIKINKNKISNL